MRLALCLVVLSAIGLFIAGCSDDDYGKGLNEPDAGDDAGVSIDGGSLEDQGTD